MKRVALALAAGIALHGSGPTLEAQSQDGASRGAQRERSSAPVEIPLEVVEGRLIVDVTLPGGGTVPFVFGLSYSTLTESGAARLGPDLGGATVGGLPVLLDQAETVSDDVLAMEGLVPGGVLGGLTFKDYDVLVDVPNGRLLVKPVGRSVSWEGVELSNPVGLTVYHDVLPRVDVGVGEGVYGGLLDLSAPWLEVNEPVATANGFAPEDRTDFRMGYGSFTGLPVRVGDSQILRGWDRDGSGFVVVGAPVAYDCAIAVSVYHLEMRTCLR